MAQRTWLYKNPSGLEFEVGLYHGDESGHIVIYVGGEIIQIDFSVKDGKDYQFMLEQELFKLSYNPDWSNKYELFNETTKKEIPLIGMPARNPLHRRLLILFVIFLVLVFMSILLLVFSMF
ncbi:MAG: hypothetical protein LC107_10880 [Chitinophagales bacterium]|nr:hypothetical protein [Chitinophagales bacterium]